jgi:hypothetical protein
MKKRIALSILMFILFAGVVSASSSNGNYKGYSIVNVEVDGKKFVGAVPAINMDGTTLVPVRFVSEAMGASVAWNKDTFTATISSSGKTTSTNSTISDFKKFSTDAVEVLSHVGVSLDSAEITIDDKGLVVKFRWKETENITQEYFMSQVDTVSTYASVLDFPRGKYPIDLVIISYKSGFVIISYADVIQYMEDHDLNKFKKTWSVYKV